MLNQATQQRILAALAAVGCDGQAAAQEGYLPAEFAAELTADLRKGWSLVDALGRTQAFDPDLITLLQDAQRNHRLAEVLRHVQYEHLRLVAWRKRLLRILWLTPLLAALPLAGVVISSQALLTLVRDHNLLMTFGSGNTTSKHLINSLTLLIRASPLVLLLAHGALLQLLWGMRSRPSMPIPGAGLLRHRDAFRVVAALQSARLAGSDLASGLRLAGSVCRGKTLARQVQLAAVQLHAGREPSQVLAELQALPSGLALALSVSETLPLPAAQPAPQWLTDLLADQEREVARCFVQLELRLSCIWVVVLLLSILALADPSGVMQVMQIAEVLW